MLKTKNSQIYIGQKNKNKFGYVRFDKRKNRVYEISIANLPNFYSKGLGTKMLNLSLRKFIKEYNPKKITAVISKFNMKKDNYYEHQKQEFEK